METEADHRIKPRLLVVDADEAVRSALRRLLEKAGYEVQLALDSNAGTAVLAAEAVDLAIIDLDTFANDGQALVEQLCRPGVLCPVLMLARASDASDREEAFQVGGLLVKPVDAWVFLQTVGILLRSSSYTRPNVRPESRVLALRRLQARGARFLRCNMPHRPLYH